MNHYEQTMGSCYCTCWRKMRLTRGRSAIFPKTILPRPEVIPMQVTRVPPFLSGRRSFTCWTYQEEIRVFYRRTLFHAKTILQPDPRMLSDLLYCAFGAWYIIMGDKVQQLCRKKVRTLCKSFAGEGGNLVRCVTHVSKSFLFLPMRTSKVEIVGTRSTANEVTKYRLAEKNSL